MLVLVLADMPAAMGNRWITAMRVYDALIGCLNQAIPGGSAVPPLQPAPTDSTNTPNNDFQSTMTAEMALAEPSLQDFLTQADLDLGFLDTQMQDSRFQNIYFPLTFRDQEWA